REREQEAVDRAPLHGPRLERGDLRLLERAGVVLGQDVQAVMEDDRLRAGPLLARKGELVASHEVEVAAPEAPFGEALERSVARGQGGILDLEQIANHRQEPADPAVLDEVDPALPEERPAQDVDAEAEQ